MLAPDEKRTKPTIVDVEPDARLAHEEHDATDVWEPL